MKKTIIDLFESSVRRYPDNPFLWEKTTNAFEPTTYKEVQQQVYTAGAGLIALGVLGVLPPATSALLHNTSTLLISLKSMQNLLPE